MQVLASQLPFLANRKAELAVPPLFWPDNCIKIGGHVALLSGATVYSLYCDHTILYSKNINTRVYRVRETRGKFARNEKLRGKTSTKCE